MATTNGLTIQASISATPTGTAGIASGTLTKTLDIAGDDVDTHTQVIASAAWAADAGHTLSIAAAIATLGALCIKNLDSANYVEVSLNSTGTQIFCQIKAGTMMLLPLAATPLYLKANTADVRIQVWAVEN